MSPTTSRLRNVSSPARVIPPRRVLPTVEWSFGVSPSQAAKSRPDLKACGSGVFITSSDAEMWPIVGTAVRRRDIALARCQASSLASAAARRVSSLANSSATSTPCS